MKIKLNDIEKYLNQKEIRLNIMLYDEITRRFRKEGYSWKEAQRKADIEMGIEN